jgi:hypothetical protein
MGSNAGGRITLRHKTGVELFNGYWMPDGSSVTFENCLFTDQGAGGPYNGATLWFIAEAGETISVTIDNCVFDWPHPWGNVRIMNSGSTGVMNATISNSVFQNCDTPIFTPGGHTTVTNCLFMDWYDFAIDAGLGVWEIGDFNDTLDVSNSVFYATQTTAYGTGTVGVFMGSSKDGTTITIDHCDFLSDVAGVFEAGAVQNVWSGAADCSVTNSNIDLPAISLNDGTDQTPTLTYDYCNMNGGVSGLWTGGTNNVSPFIPPDYADVPNDWSYTDDTLLRSDSAGGAVGSFYPSGSPGPRIPVAGILGIVFLMGAVAASGAVFLRNRG